MGYNDHHDNLNLGLGISAVKKQPPSSNASTTTAEPSLTLALSTGSTATDHHYSSAHNKNGLNNSTVIDINKGAFVADANANNNGSYGRQASPASAVSSFSGGGAVAIKREREVMSSEEAEVDHDEKVSNSRDQSVDEDEDGSNARKKLRLTKDQSALLEESFKLHSTLNPKQKQALARQLNLRARQVEVWFQNRRARTKLKQTEVDCEFLKKCCETLTDENRRLQKELQELKALKLAQPLYMHMPAATLTMCPSCERIGAPASATSAGDLVAGGGGAGGGGVGIGVGVGVSKSSFTSMAHHPKPHFYNPFTNPSAAC